MADADARSRFFDNMERELLESVGPPDDNVEFEITESGRTVTHMDFCSTRSLDGMLALHEASAKSSARGIPVPQVQQISLPQSQASSQGSSGSGSNFLSSVLNVNNNTVLSHTPPTGLGTSYEALHFGKRARSGSVSGRLRSASEYLEDKGLLDRNTKAILKDLIIIGDEEMQLALDKYEAGDPSHLEAMIQTGALQNRLPADLDLLGDLDLDFLTVNDDLGIIDHPSLQAQSQPIPMVKRKVAPDGDLQPNLVSPAYDDGIGDLEFAGDFVSDAHVDFDDLASGVGSKQASMAASPDLSEYERRMRSNSLFSALLDTQPTQGYATGFATIQEGGRSGKWMDDFAVPAETISQGIQIQKPAGRRSLSSIRSGIGVSLSEQEKKTRKEKKKDKKDVLSDDETPEEHITGSGMPRSLSDPNLRVSYDALGLLEVERPEGWIGAYSPDSRRVRIEKFMSKRNNRVWTKSIKYDVRKNFADSRLRVKGRFVRKEDELLMRELMSLT